MTIKEYYPLHPGEFISRVYIDPLGLNVNDLSEKLGVTTAELDNLLKCHSDVDKTMALGLSKALGRSPESWLLMQDQFNKQNANW